MQKTFSLKELENLCGIKSHTLRTWEKRYGILNPQRSAGNKRFYKIEDLSKILYLSLLNSAGFKISALSKLSSLEIIQRIIGLNKEKIHHRKIVIDLIIYMYQLDMERFDATLDNCFSQLRTVVIMTDIIQQFLIMTGLLWNGNRLTEEHFAVTIIRSKMMKAIDLVRNAEEGKNSTLLFLPGKGQLDLMLLYTNYLLRFNGSHVLYMGNDVSVKNLETVIDLKKPQYILTYLHKQNHLDLQEISFFLNGFTYNPILIVTCVEMPLPEKSKMENVLYMKHQDAVRLICNK